MYKLEPVVSEKSLLLAKQGKYCFWVPVELNKFEIRSLIEKVFSVHVRDIRTINSKGREVMSIRRKKRTIKPTKKAIVTLKEKEKIDIFEESKK